MTKNQHRKMFKMDCLDITTEKTDTGGAEVTTHIQRGDYYGGNKKDAIEWFKSILTQNPKGTSRSTIMCFELDLPERKDVWTKGYWIGVLIGCVIVVATNVIIHFINL